MLCDERDKYILPHITRNQGHFEPTDNKPIRSREMQSISRQKHYDGPRVVLGSPSFPRLQTGLNDPQMATSR